MSTYPLTVTDRPAPELAGHPKVSNWNLSQPREDTLALARALTGQPQLPDESRAWRHAQPGGTPGVRIELAP